MEVEKDKSREETSNESKKKKQKTTLHHQIKYGTKKEDLKKKTSAKKQVSHSIQRITHCHDKASRKWQGHEKS